MAGMGCSRLRSALVRGGEGLVTQGLRRTLKVQPLNHGKRGGFRFGKVQHRPSLAMPEPNQFCIVSKGGDKVERAGSVDARRALLFDMGRVSHIKDGQLGAVVLFDIEKRSAISCSM